MALLWAFGILKTLKNALFGVWTKGYYLTQNPKISGFLSFSSSGNSQKYPLFLVYKTALKRACHLRDTEGGRVQIAREVITNGEGREINIK